jgi:hypothetical protein
MKTITDRDLSLVWTFNSDSSEVAYAFISTDRLEGSRASHVKTTPIRVSVQIFNQEVSDLQNIAEQQYFTARVATSNYTRKAFQAKARQCYQMAVLFDALRVEVFHEHDPGPPGS